MTIWQHIRHPRLASRLADRPVKVTDLLPRGTAVTRFNTRDALLGFVKLFGPTGRHGFWPHCGGVSVVARAN